VRIPYGFSSLEDYNKFTAEMKAMLPEGTEIYFQGSSVTGLVIVLDYLLIIIEQAILILH